MRPSKFDFADINSQSSRFFSLGMIVLYLLPAIRRMFHVNLSFLKSAPFLRNIIDVSNACTMNWVHYNKTIELLLQILCR